MPSKKFETLKATNPKNCKTAGAGVPKPPKNRFLKAWEAQNGGFGTGQGRGRAGAAAGQQHGQQQGQ